MADSNPAQSTNASAAKTRNPVERLIVWGVIGVLLVAVAIEFQSRTSHRNVLTALLSKIKAVDEDSTQPEVTEAVVKEVVGDRKPSRAEAVTGGPLAAIGAKRVEVYSWFTLNPTSKREIWVLYGGKGKDSNELATVIEVRTSENVDEPSEVAAAGTGNPPAGGPGGGQGMGPGYTGGPQAGMAGPPGGMGGGRGMSPPGGGQRGRPGAGPAADGAANAGADKPDADKASEEKSDAEKTDADKTEKSEDKTEKSDTDKE